jgi:hypothetical protein
MPKKKKPTLWQRILGNKPTSTARRKQLMKTTKKGQKSLAEQMNFGGKYGRK